MTTIEATSTNSPQPLQDFVAFFKREGMELDAEDLMDMFWLADRIGFSLPRSTPIPEQESNVEVRSQQNQEVIAPPLSREEPKVPITPNQNEPTKKESSFGGGAGLPLQIPAATALRSQLELTRALRPIARKIPSRSQWILDEEATAIQIAELNITSPVLVNASERWLDLAIVVEDSPSLDIWAETIAEFQRLVEQLGIFRQTRTWRLRDRPDRNVEIAANWQKPQSYRPNTALSDPTGRRPIWLVSDCTSALWDRPQIYRTIRAWGKAAPFAIVQLFPERLWDRTALGEGEFVQMRSTSAAIPMDRLEATPVYPPEEWEEAKTDAIAFPVISLEPEPLKRWTKVTAGTRDASVVGIELDLGLLDRDVELAPDSNLIVPSLSPAQCLQRFSMASEIAQELARLMATVTVSLPIAHIIQKELLPASRQVHVAEVFMSGLMERIPDSQPPQYRFIEEIRQQLIAKNLKSETMRVIDTVSAYIARSFGLGMKSFAALIADPKLTEEKKVGLQPFAEIALSTVKLLGDDYRALAERWEQAYNSPPPVKPEEENTFTVPTLEILEFTTAQLVESSTDRDWLPPLQTEEYTVATIAFEELTPLIPAIELEQFDFKVGYLVNSGNGWVVQKSDGQAYRYIEQIHDDIRLEMVTINGGEFMMGSPAKELQRYDDESSHLVTVPDFYMGRYPVTQAQWRSVAGLPQVERELELDPSNFKGDHRPVEQVSREDTIEFCARLSAYTNRLYRLPTEAEWEYACRAGTTTPFHFGETISPELANYDSSVAYADSPTSESRGETTPVDHFDIANAWGLCDMHGNVWEWCQDRWHDNYEGAPEDGSAWMSEDSENIRYVWRGGSWLSNPGDCRSAFRDGYPDGRFSDLGFRLACSAPELL